VVSRSSGWAEVRPTVSGPILVCTNADDLEDIIHSTPADRLRDLVFIQNGMLDTFLAQHGCQGNTRGLLYFAVPKRGLEPQPGEESVFSGPHAETMTRLFASLDLAARGVVRSEFSNEMASKLIWNCVFGLLCDVFDQPVGWVCTEERGAVDALVAELVEVVNRGIGTTIKANPTSDDLVSYSMSIPSYQGTLKQWVWRNGWFVEAADRLKFKTPIHDEFLVGRRPVGR